MKNLVILFLVLVIWVMGEMDITPNEALHLVQHTLPNFIKYKLSKKKLKKGLTLSNILRILWYEK